eukprot:1158911-Pelagomonas_calceolata.AAC.2
MKVGCILPVREQATKPGQEQSAMELQEEDLGDEDQEWQQNATLQCGVAPIRCAVFMAMW